MRYAAAVVILVLLAGCDPGSVPTREKRPTGAGRSYVIAPTGAGPMSFTSCAEARAHGIACDEVGK